MFVMREDPEFETEAAGKLPGEQGEPFSFLPRFVALGATEQKTFDLSTEEGTAAFLKRTFVGLSDVVAADGQPVPFTSETRDWLIDKAHTRSALVSAYFSGVYKGALGN